MAATRSRLVVLIAGASLLVSGLVVAGPGAARAADAGSADALPGARTFTGTGTGAIPDGPAECGTGSGELNVVFHAFESGMPQRGLSDVRVTGLQIAHQYVGDLTVMLIAPNVPAESSSAARAPCRPVPETPATSWGRTPSPTTPRVGVGRCGGGGRH